MATDRPYLQIGNWIFRPETITHAAVSDDRQVVTLYFTSGDDVRLVDNEAAAVARWLLEQTEALPVATESGATDEVAALVANTDAEATDKATPRQVTSRRRKTTA